MSIQDMAYETLWLMLALGLLAMVGLVAEMWIENRKQARRKAERNRGDDNAGR